MRRLADVLAALGDGFGDIAVLPVHSRAGRGRQFACWCAPQGQPRAARAAAGIELNDGEGKPTAEAEAVLRGGASAAAG